MTQDAFNRDIFQKADTAYLSNPRYDAGVYPQALDAVLNETHFKDAFASIKTWKGYEASPLVHLTGLAKAAGFGDILYKHEGERFGLHSFKALGGAYSVLQLLASEVSKRSGETVTIDDIQAGKYQEIIQKITIVTATDGNHGRSVAWGCQQFGANCFIYMHAGVSKGRAKAVEALGATVVWVDGNYDESVHRAAQDASDNGYFVVSDTSYEGYTEPPRYVMAGYTVMTSEIQEQLAEGDIPTHVFIQGGVGGLAAAVCTHFWQMFQDKKPRFVVVEPDRAACLFESGKAGETVDVHITEETVMAGLSCGEVSKLGWEILQTGVADFMTISDDIVAPTMKLLGQGVNGDEVLVAGESAVAGLAGILAASQDPALKSALGLDNTSKILVIGTEGATDPEIYTELVGMTPEAVAA